MNPIDENLVQQCIDGELSEEGQQALLKTCESLRDGSGWRQLALSYVEKGVFEDFFRDSNIHFHASNEQTGSPEHQIHENDGTLKRNHFPSDNVKATRSARVKPSEQLPMWLTMVSALTLGVCATLLCQQFFFSPTQDGTNIAQSDSIPSPANSQSEPDLIVPLDDNAVDVTLPNSNTPTKTASVLISNGNGQSARLPLLSPDEFRQSPEYHQGGLFPEEVKQQLEARGFVVERKPRWYQVPLKDGRHVYFPAESVQVRHAVQ